MTKNEIQHNKGVAIDHQVKVVTELNHCHSILQFNNRILREILNY